MSFFSQGSLIHQLKIYWTEFWLVHMNWSSSSQKVQNIPNFLMFFGNNQLIWNPTKPIETRCGQSTDVSYLKSNSSTHRINVMVKRLTSFSREWLPLCSCCDLCIVLNLYENLHSYAHCNCRTARFLNFVHYLILRGPIREYNSFCRTQLCTSALIPLRTGTGPTAEVCFLF